MDSYTADFFIFFTLRLQNIIIHQNMLQKSKELSSYVVPFCMDSTLGP